MGYNRRALLESRYDIFECELWRLQRSDVISACRFLCGNAFYVQNQIFSNLLKAIVHDCVKKKNRAISSGKYFKNIFFDIYFQVKSLLKIVHKRYCTVDQA